MPTTKLYLIFDPSQKGKVIYLGSSNSRAREITEGNLDLVVRHIYSMENLDYELTRLADSWYGPDFEDSSFDLEACSMDSDTGEKSPVENTSTTNQSQEYTIADLIEEGKELLSDITNAFVSSFKEEVAKASKPTNPLDSINQQLKKVKQAVSDKQQESKQQAKDLLRSVGQSLSKLGQTLQDKAK